MAALVRLTLGLALALGTVLVPTTATALEVDCSNAFGDCTVNNDGVDSVFCNCGDTGGTDTGGMMYAGLDEAELLEVCHDLLDICGGDGTTTEVGSSSVGVTTDETES